jgi:hypothetical protein
MSGTTTQMYYQIFVVYLQVAITYYVNIKNNIKINYETYHFNYCGAYRSIRSIWSAATAASK